VIFQGLSFPCLRARALQRAGVQTGIQIYPYENREPKNMDSCFRRNDGKAANYFRNKVNNNVRRMLIMMEVVIGK
jgi:hypothetical protein